jgi:hypothetical protein
MGAYLAARTIQGSDPDACWVWAGTTSGSGYGFARFCGRSMHAHRAAWEYVHGPIPEGMLACHRCDTPLCVNPSHLFVGTDADNHQDKAIKGRAAKKLSAEAVIAIRSRYKRGVITMAAVGAEFGVTACTVCAVVNRRTWAHVQAGVG